MGSNPTSSVENRGIYINRPRLRGARRLANRLLRHRRELTPFLNEELDGTNNAAERALRPAVVARKVTGGSRSDRGGWAVVASVLQTAPSRAATPVATLKEVMM